MMDDIDREFTWWQNALKGERGPIDGDNPRAGYYRSKAKDKTLGAVAYWYDSNSSELRCQQNGRDIDDLRAREMWPHVSRRPIAEDVFWHFRDTGIWRMLTRLHRYLRPRLSALVWLRRRWQHLTNV